MAHVKEKQFPARSFAERLDSMFRVDARRMFDTPLFWICLGIAFVIPVLVLVMTSGFGGEGGAIFAAAIGAVSNVVLKKSSLVG